MDGATFPIPTFQTPARILVPKLVKSRAGWKTKANQRKKRLKTARIRIRDLEISRDKWKDRTRAAESQVAELKKELEQAKQERAGERTENDRLRDELKKK
jgi:predicted  nucleic acid-binding Zn-ribbon protein